MRILVTGGAGFLGSNLCARLARNASDHIYCLDSLVTGEMRNIAPLMELPNFEFIRQDVIQPFDLAVDQIYNAACPASPVAYQRDPIHTMKTSVLGIINLLDLADRCGATLLHFSTSEVYGDALVHPQPEEYWGNVNPDGVRSCYDEGKRAAETLCFDYRRMHGTKVKIIRVFNTYGPNMKPSDGRVVSNFIRQALLGEDITIFGDGSQTRSFCFVDDLIEGVVRMMNAPAEVTGPINLGNPGEFTVNELAELVLGKIPTKSRLIRCALPSDDPKVRRPDIHRAMEQLGWAPKIPLSEGLDRTIAYFRERLEIAAGAKEKEC